MTELREKTDVMQDDGGGVEDQKLLKFKWQFVHFILQIYMFIHTARQKNPQTHSAIFKFGRNSTTSKVLNIVRPCHKFKL